MKEKKEIVIKGRKFQYQTMWDCGELDEWEWTEFFDGVKTQTKRKFWIVGEKYTVDVPKLVFTVNFNIESPIFTKAWLRERLEKEVELLNRKAEIERGELI